MVGWLSGRVWLAPVWLVAVLAFVLATPKVPAQDVDARWAEAYGFGRCVKSRMVDVQVCAPSPDAGYLPAGLRTVEGLYASSAHPEVLPTTVRLVTASVIGKQEGPGVVPAIGQTRGRGLVPPPTIHGPSAESLAYTTQAWCRGAELSDLQPLFGLSETAPTPTMAATLDALRTCRARG